MTSRFAPLVHESWLEFLKDDEALLESIGQHLREENNQGFEYAPHSANIFRALQMPISSVRVLIVGQDPYPTKGHAVGLAFSVPEELSPIPASLRNIFQELHDDCGCAKSPHGNLQSWVDQGVLLLNRTLTVRVGVARSHFKYGWDTITLHAIQGLARTNQQFVSILWGSDAQSLMPYLDEKRVIKSVHPSPLSAHRGFFGSGPFSRANQILTELGVDPIDWCLPHKEIS